MFGALLALASAAFFGLNNATLRRGVVTGSVLQAMAITVPLGVPILALLALPFGGYTAMAEWSAATWGLMALAGVVHFVVGRYGNYKAAQVLGSTLSAPIQQISVLVALGLAFAFLGETLSLLNLFGVLLVVVGPMTLIRRRKAATEAGRAKGMDPQYGPGFFWGMVCAFGYGSSPLFIALALQDRGIAHSIAGVLVSYAAASVVVVAWAVIQTGPRFLAGIDRTAAKWFVLTALFVGTSQVFRYMALAVAPVVVVMPIQRLSVVFRLIFNGLLNRRYEVFDRWIVVAILISVVGAVTLAADTESLLAWLGIGGVEWLARPVL